jgi:hypothetical protein
MGYLYYFINIVFTSWVFAPALSITGYIILSLKAKVLKKTIISLILMSSVYLIIYIIFMGISYYFLGFNVFASMVVNIILILLLEWKKFLGIDPIMKKNFEEMFRSVLN